MSGLTKTQRSLAKGLLAGLVAGLVATAAKTLGEKFYPPRTHGEPEPPEVLAKKLAPHPLNATELAVASETIHWAFGALSGAAYGALAEFYPAAAADEGAAFGLALMALTHETAVPAMGLAAEPKDQTAREQSSEAATHVLYGVVAERVRSFVRGMLG